MIKRPMPNQSIIYNKIGSHRPSQVTHLPIDSKYNIPSWNETLFMQNSNYEIIGFQMPCQYPLRLL